MDNYQILKRMTNIHAVCVFSTVGVFSIMGDILSAVGGILSTMEGVQYHGGCSALWGYHDTCGRYTECPGG